MKIRFIKEYLKKKYNMPDKASQKKKILQKDVIIVILAVVILISAFYIYFIQQNLEKDKIDLFEYQEALRHVMVEGGGFNYSAAEDYIMADNLQIVALARELKTPEAAFEYVFHEIDYDSDVSEEYLYPMVVAVKKVSNCVGQANLLASLLRAMKISAKEVYVVYGRIQKGDKRGNHAWVSLLWEGKWYALDATTLTPYKGLKGYPREEFYKDFKAVPVIRYNDTTRYFVELGSTEDTPALP